MAKRKLTAEEKKITQAMKRTSKGAEKKAKDTEPEVKGQQLPGGLINATAQFTKYKVGMAKNKFPYLILTGIVQEPSEFQGARAQRSYFLSPPKKKGQKTLAEKYEGMFSDLQLLGINTSEMSGTTVLDEVIIALKDLQEEKPLFLFNTWKPDDPNSDTMVFIQGLADEQSDDEMYEEDEEEDSDEAEEDEEESEEEGDEEEYEEDEEEGDEYEDEEEEETEETEEAEEDEEETEDDESWEPEKGELYGYAVNSTAQAYPCEIIKVSKRNRTVDLKRVKDDKVFKSKSWDNLQDYEEE